MSNRKNIKLDEELFERLKADKGERRSWPQYFEDQLAEDESDGTSEVTLEATEYEAIARRVAERLR